MHSATLQKTRGIRILDSEATRQNHGEGLRVIFGAAGDRGEARLCSYLGQAGVAYDAVESVEQLRNSLASSNRVLAVISLGFWRNGAKHVFELPRDDFSGLQFALWVGDEPVEIDCVVDAIRLGAVAVIHGASCESRLLSVIKEAQLNIAKAATVVEVHDWENGSISDGGDDSTPASLSQTTSHASGVQRKVSEKKSRNGVPDLNGYHSVNLPAHRTHQDVTAASRGSVFPNEQLKRTILGHSASVQSIRNTILNVASTRATVMIFGESGTGKELVARAIHHFSDRSQQPFVPVNMSAIPEGLAESLLFGHEKGSFTSAHERHKGWCQTAHGGTLFLDEIGDMELAVQPKLLRFLQEGTMQTVGARSHSSVDVRVITATNRDPKTIVREGRLREDLFFRLHVVPIFVPPLRERREDIAGLAMFFLHRAAERHGRNVTGLSEEAIQVLSRFNWPGNVRQLENAIERVVIFAEGETAQAMDIPAEFHAPGRSWGNCANGRTETQRNGNGVYPNADDDDAEDVVGKLTPYQLNERAAIIDALQRSAGHVVDAAKLLGLGQATMYRKIKQFAVPHERKRRKLSPK